MNRSDKHLYLVWPRVMAALKEYEKARVSEHWSRSVLIVCHYGTRVCWS